MRMRYINLHLTCTYFTKTSVTVIVTVFFRLSVLTEPVCEHWKLVEQKP